MRVGEMQTWPMLRNLPMVVTFAAASTSTSGKMMTGAWPPSSKEIRFTWPAARRISSLPTSVEPVKLILRTARFSMNSSVISCGAPVTRFATPGGPPASWRHWNSSIVASGVWLAGPHQLRPRLAGQGPGHRLETLAHQLCRPLQHGGALVSGLRGPLGEGAGGGGHRPGGVLPAPIRNLGDDLLVRGIDDAERFA